nr:hypothetical protein [uncultured Acetatifactor sp.]
MGYTYSGNSFETTVRLAYFEQYWEPVVVVVIGGPSAPSSLYYLA